MFNNNTGDRNTGHWNTGHWNAGDWNTGDRNTGHCNTGNRNTGHCNTGNRNTGNRNTGHCNTGNRNTGDRNTGHCNTGNRNTGHCNTGYANSTNRSSGIFCTIEPNIISFNKDSGLKWDQISHPNLDNFYLTKWVLESEMTEQEKKENPTFKSCGGYSKSLTYQEAWANFWRDTDEENRKRFLNLPNFDAAIFKEITGIDVESKSCAGKIVEIDGKKYKLSEV